jgi:hypothetical protein
MKRTREGGREGRREGNQKVEEKEGMVCSK